MYKTIGRKRQYSRRPWKLRWPKPEKRKRKSKVGEQRRIKAKRGIVVRVTKGQQEIKIIGRSGLKGVLCFKGPAAIEGANVGDVILLRYNSALDVWLASKVNTV